MPAGADELEIGKFLALLWRKRPKPQFTKPAVGPEQIAPVGAQE